jgi:hypothetical protein
MCRVKTRHTPPPQFPAPTDLIVNLLTQRETGVSNGKAQPLAPAKPHARLSPENAPLMRGAAKGAKTMGTSMARRQPLTTIPATSTIAFFEKKPLVDLPEEEPLLVRNFSLPWQIGLQPVTKHVSDRDLSDDSSPSTPSFSRQSTFPLETVEEDAFSTATTLRSSSLSGSVHSNGSAETSRSSNSDTLYDPEVFSKPASPTAETWALSGSAAVAAAFEEASRPRKSVSASLYPHYDAGDRPAPDRKASSGGTVGGSLIRQARTIMKRAMSAPNLLQSVPTLTRSLTNSVSRMVKPLPTVLPPMAPEAQAALLENASEEVKKDILDGRDRLDARFLKRSSLVMKGETLKEAITRRDGTAAQAIAMYKDTLADISKNAGKMRAASLEAGFNEAPADAGLLKALIEPLGVEPSRLPEEMLAQPTADPSFLPSPGTTSPDTGITVEARLDAVLKLVDERLAALAKKA